MKQIIKFEFKHSLTRSSFGLLLLVSLIIVGTVNAYDCDEMAAAGEAAARDAGRVVITKVLELEAELVAMTAQRDFEIGNARIAETTLAASLAQSRWHRAIAIVQFENQQKRLVKAKLEILRAQTRLAEFEVALSVARGALVRFRSACSADKE